MTSRALPTIEPEAILRDLLGLDPGLRRERYWGERSIFYNPGRVAPLGAIFASIKDHDGANDSSAKLSAKYGLAVVHEIRPPLYTEQLDAPNW